MTAQGSLLFGAAALILALVWFAIKAVVGHLMAHYALKRAQQKWGRQPKDRK